MTERTTDELTRQDRAEVVNLYHLARTYSLPWVGPSSRHARMVWAANEYGKEHGIPAVRAYKALSEELES